MAIQILKTKFFYKLFISLGVIIITFGILLPSILFAANYGEGSYGSGNYNVGPVPTPSTASSSNNSSSSSSVSDSHSCTDTTPTSIPDLFQINTTSSTAKLYFTTTKNTSGYSISYGFKKDEEKFGTNINYSGSGWIIDTTINALTPNTIYYFKIRSLNGCNAGSWSNSILVKIPNGKQTAIFYKTLVSRIKSLATSFVGSKTINSHQKVTTSQPSTQIQSCEYIVQSGDTLWNISSSKLGSGSKYKAIILQNNLSSTNIKTGQKLKIGC